MINVFIRDFDEIAATDVGLKALNIHSMKTEKRGLADLNLPATFNGQTIQPGDWVYSDNNGVAVNTEALEL